MEAKLRPGNVHSAEDWDKVLLPQIERQLPGGAIQCERPCTLTRTVAGRIIAAVCGGQETDSDTMEILG
jgi:hypothetical protein